MMNLYCFFVENTTAPTLTIIGTVIFIVYTTRRVIDWYSFFFLTSAEIPQLRCVFLAAIRKNVVPITHYKNPQPLELAFIAKWSCLCSCEAECDKTKTTDFATFSMKFRMGISLF